MVNEKQVLESTSVSVHDLLSVFRDHSRVFAQHTKIRVVCRSSPGGRKVREIGNLTSDFHLVSSFDSGRLRSNDSLTSEEPASQHTAVKTLP